MSSYEGTTVRLTQSCPMCQGTMEEGFVRDRMYGGNMAGEWVAGHPQVSFWTGIKIDRSYHLSAYRGPQCGFVALYATEPVKD